MGEDMSKLAIGIITFHHSYNCGSMLQTYALQAVLERMGHTVRIINFSNEGQHRLYSVFAPATSPKNIIKNLVLLPHAARIRRNNESYEGFISSYFKLDGPEKRTYNQLDDSGFSAIVAGSDQVWNVTIDDGDIAYFLPWVKRARKIAYAPSFGARDISAYSDTPELYRDLIREFDALSIREANGRKWIKELTGIDVPVLLDPTLLLSADDYRLIEQPVDGLPSKYIFYYSPGYSSDINDLVKEVSKRYGLPVVAFNSKTFFTKAMNFTSDFVLPELENPSTYLYLIRNAEMIFTTSFHGTVFSALFHKTFWTVKNGGMLGDDDRVATLANSLGLADHLVPIGYDPSSDYARVFDYSEFEDSRSVERQHAIHYLKQAVS